MPVRYSFILKFLRSSFLPVVLAPFILFAWPLFNGRTLFWGLPALQFIPWQAYAWQQISQGIFPLWNPLLGLGAPLMANYQLALFYPPTWLGYVSALIGGTPALAWAQTLLVPLHLAWAGIGMVLLMRRMGGNPLAQTISGLCFAMSGYFIARTGFYTMIWAGAWLPWVVWSASEIAMPVRGSVALRKKFSFAFILCLTSQLLAGHAQITWYTILITVLWVFSGGWINGGWKNGVKKTMILLYHGIIAASLAAIQLIPTAEYLISSQRSTAVDYELGSTYSFWPWRLLTLLAPNLFGNPGTANYWGYASFWEDAIYIGLLPLILAVTTLFKIWRNQSQNPFQPFIRLAWVTAVASLLLALGNNTPVFPFLYKYIPTFGLFNAPARWLIWLVFMFSLLAGIGSMSWSRPIGRELKKFRRLTVASLAVTLGAVITWVILRAIKITFIEATALMGVWATGICLLTLKKPSETDSAKPRVIWEWAVIGWLMLDLLWANWALQPTVPANLFSENFDNNVISQTSGRVVMDARLEYDIKFRRFFRFSDYTPIEDWQNLRLIALPNINLISHKQFQYVNNFDPLLQEGYASWMEWLAGSPASVRDQLYQLMNVSVEIERDIYNPLGVIAKPINGHQRIRWYSCADLLTDKTAVWKSLQEADINSDQTVLFRKVFLEANNTTLNTGCSTETMATWNIVEDAPGTLSLNIQASGSGYLFLSDSWYPGWTAWVDEVETPIFKADVLFRAVPVENGLHTIKLEYRPNSFYLGGAVTLLGLFFMVLIFLFSKHRVK